MDSGAIARLQQIATTPFERVTYTRAIEILEDVVKSKKKKFEFPVSPRHFSTAPHRARAIWGQLFTAAHNHNTVKGSRGR